MSHHGRLLRDAGGAPEKPEHAASLSGALRNDVHNGDTETCRLDCLSGHIDLLINATPVGMYPQIDEMPVGAKF